MSEEDGLGIAVYVLLQAAVFVFEKRSLIFYEGFRIGLQFVCFCYTKLIDFEIIT